MPVKPVVLIPWHEDFIARLHECVVEEVAEDPENTVVVFPHRRPRRYLLDRFQGDQRLPKPCFLPQMASVGDWTARLRRELAPSPLRALGLLDQVGLLHEIVHDLQEEGAGLIARLQLDLNRFFPWGARLADLLEELFRQNRPPADLPLLSGEVLPWAEALLRHLKTIHGRYVDRLEETSSTTPGYDAFWLTRHPDLVVEHLRGRRIHLAGFYVLNGCEEALFRRLWEEGLATVYWHGDPALARGRTGHWACREHWQWKERWDAGVEEADSPLSGQGNEPPEDSENGRRDRFYEGFDLHSQLAMLSRELDDGESLRPAAVVLPDEGALMPVLHHLPRKGVNVSMGYPFKRSALYRLLQTLMEIQETALEPGRYSWRPVVDLLRHPYLKALTVDGEQPLRRLFYFREKDIRAGRRYLDPFSWEPPPQAFADGANEEKIRALFRRILQTCLKDWESLQTLEDLAGALENLGRLLLEHGAGPWDRFRLDVECIHRLFDTIIPELAGSRISGRDLSVSQGPPAQILFSVLREYCQREKVPFEGEPLVGLQVMGVLETRLLHFRKVLVIQAIEGQLPSTPPYDPLLPDSLRHLLQLPDGRHRDRVAAYNFYRLVQGAREAVFFYHTGVHGTGMLEDKGVRSRYVEQLLWKTEQQENRIHKPQRNEGPLRAIEFPVRPIPAPVQRSIDKTGPVRRRIDEWLGKHPLSPTVLDHYLQCPVSFFYRYLGRLAPLDEVKEEDAGALGQLVHRVLKEFLQPLGKGLVVPEDVPVEPLLERYMKGLHAEEFFRHASYPRRLVLEHVGKERLRRFWRGQKPFKIKALEKTFEDALEAGGRTVRLKGRLDRVDERDEGLVVLDYKTGYTAREKLEAWEDEDLWKKLESPESVGDDDLFQSLSERMGSLQLPFYLYLYWKGAKELPANGAWVELRKDGEELWLFSSKVPESRRQDIIRRKTPLLVAFLVRHLLENPRFLSQPAESCAKRCPFQGSC